MGDVEGVTVEGEKLHVAPAGKPEQANDTNALNPFEGVTVMVAVPDCPWFTVIDAGDAAKEKSGGGKLMVYAALATGLLLNPLATAIAEMVSDRETVIAP